MYVSVWVVCELPVSPGGALQGEGIGDWAWSLRGQRDPQPGNYSTPTQLNSASQETIISL